MSDLSALREAVVNCNASAALKALPALLDRIAELEEREKTLVVFANAAMENQRQADSALAVLREQRGECVWTVDEDGTPHSGCNGHTGYLDGPYCAFCGKLGAWARRET